MTAPLERVAQLLGTRVCRDEPLASHTSIRVGGPADLLIVCRTVEELVEGVRLAQANDVPWQVLGGGCNVLVADEGVRGLVLINKAGRLEFCDNTVRVEAGASMTGLAQESVRRGLMGLEWAAGLPGTVGGAVVGNAGAFGGDVASVLREVMLLERDGTTMDRPAGWLELGYRESCIKRLAPSERQVVLAAVFALRRGEPDDLAALADGILQWRKTRHPSGATMGSTFKNPPDGHAGWLIEQAGLKGYRIGGVMVSELHGNFFINTGEGTAADVLALIRHTQRVVEERMGVRLELEVELTGAWGAADKE